MSYCRWSSDDYQCDIYVYEGMNGWVTHVAAKRYVFTEPLPPLVPVDDIHAWIHRHLEVSKLLKSANLGPIGLPHDGQTFVDASPGECAQRLTKLRSLGYRCPKTVIDELLEEQSEM